MSEINSNHYNVVLVFTEKNVLLYKGNDNEQSVDITFLVKESYISKSDGEIQWYPEP